MLVALSRRLFSFLFFLIPFMYLPLPVPPYRHPFLSPDNASYFKMERDVKIRCALLIYSYRILEFLWRLDIRINITLYWYNYYDVTKKSLSTILVKLFYPRRNLKRKASILNTQRTRKKVRKCIIVLCFMFSFCEK